jgi:hypothetical protein
MRALLLLPLLAGCSLFDPPDPSTPQGICQVRANDDPAVHDLIVTTAGSDNAAARDAVRHLPEVKRQAVVRCLRGFGLAPPGGVEGQKTQ